MNQLTRPVWAEVDRAAIAHNVAEFRRLIDTDCQLMVVVKSDGYGHGDLETARAALASGASWLAVALPEEGVRLRRSGIAAPILVLGSLAAEQLEMCVTKDLVVTVYQWEQAQALSRIASRLQKTVRVHVKVDTGMGRLGIPVEQAVDFTAGLQRLPGVEVQGVFTHFATADQPLGEYVRFQQQRFGEALKQLTAARLRIPLRHSANTAATLYLPDTHMDMVRVGLGIYGLLPIPSKSVPGVSLKPALSLFARVTSVRRVSAGTAISYGTSYVTWRETSIAVLPIGYGDGVSRQLGNRGCVLLDETRFPIVGHVTMDHIMIDVGDHPVQIGDEAVLLGGQAADAVTADEWADWMGTISYEVTCMIGSRVPRVYVQRTDAR